MAKKRKKKPSDQASILKSIRKPLPPPTKIFKTKDEYSRKDKRWQQDDDL